MFENSIFLKIVDRYHENKLAHAFLFETNDIDRCYDDLVKLLKIINCPFDYSDDCKNIECNFCNLFDKGNLPSFCLIEPDGTQIKKNQVQEMMNKFSTIPVYSKYNMYVVLNSDKLNIASANSLLKFLEEPSDNVIGFFIASNKMNVISTIRSRCQEYSVYYSKEIDYSSYIKNIVSFLNGIYKNKDAILYNKSIAMGFYSERIEWIEFFSNMLYFIEDFIANNSNDYGILLLRDFDVNQLVKMLLLIETILKYLQSNGNIELILDKFVFEMRKIYA